MDVFPLLGELPNTSLVPEWGERRYAIDTHPVMTGLGSLSGTVTVAGVPSARRVEVYDEATLTLAASTMSAGNGTWTLAGLTKTRALCVIVRGTGGERDVTIRGLYAT
jgi:hypothetical protein